MATENPPYVKGLDARQAVASAFFELTLADFVALGNVVDIFAPPGSELIGGEFIVVESSNDTGTDTIKIGDSVDDDRYLGATNAKAAAGTRTAVTPTGYLYPGQGTSQAPFARFTRTPQNGNATTGKWRFRADYVTIGKSEWTEG